MKLLEIKAAGFGWFRHPPLFRIDELRLDEGAKILLIGQNGTGKSTLLRILSGEETLTQGEMSLRPALRITRFEQTAFFAGTVRDIFDELFQEAIEAEKALRNMEIQMQENADERLLLEYEKLCDQFDGLGGYQYLIDRNTFIETFGLATKLDIPFCLLSGGEQQYVCLAKTIFAKCELMLLDEPFSFLDHEKRKWLVAYLIKIKKPLSSFATKKNTFVVSLLKQLKLQMAWLNSILVMLFTLKKKSRKQKFVSYGTIRILKRS